VTAERIGEIEGRLATTAGTCGVMGTASTMACIAEALGMMPLGTARSPPCTPTGCARPRKPVRSRCA
jgi:dihydroxy-acid dehydratase